MTKLARRTYLAAAWFMLAGLILAPAVGAQGTVTVLCSPSVVWCDVIKEEFPKATGINLEYIRLSSGEGLARLRAEKDNPTFDVWFGGTGDPHLIAFREGLTEFYKPSSWDDLIPAFREVTGETYLPLYAGILGWAVNEQMLNSMGLPIPRTWKDLTAPVYRGLIAMPNPNTSGTGYTMLATILQIYGEDEGWKLLRDLHFNVAQYTRAGAEPGLLAGRGEVAIGITFMHDALHHAIQGFPVTVKAPADGTGFEIGGLSLVRNGPNREGAIRFIEWALSPEAQVLAAQRGESYQLPTNVKTPLDPRSPRFSDVRVIPYDFEHWGNPAVREAVVGRWTNEIYPIPRPRN